jgi:tetratricopeptide (TPR) repeat protein
MIKGFSGSCVGFRLVKPRARDAIILVCLASLSYIPSLRGPFQFDDLPVIQESPALYLGDLSWEAVRRAISSPSSPNRPVANLTFALNYYVGGMDSWGFHVVNLAIHLATIFVLYLFVQRLLTLPALWGPDSPSARQVAFITALLWGLHPVQTQAVTYIVQRMTSLATLLYLLALWCYLSARQRSSGYPRRLLFAATVVSGLLAVGTKEIAVTLPFSIVLLEAYFLGSFHPARLRAQWPVWGVVFLALIGVGAWVVWVVIDHGGVKTLFSLTTPVQPMTFPERLLTASRVIVHYMSLLLFPMPSRLVLDYHFPISTSLMAPMTTLPSMAAVLGLMVFAIGWARRWPLVSFCILWFFLQLALETLAPILDLVFEHRLYLPSVGVMILAALGIERLLGAEWGRWAVLGWIGVRVAVTALAVFLAVATWQRNLVWADEVALWSDTAKKVPTNGRAHYTLGYVYGERGRVDDAVREYREALRLRSDDHQALFGIGLIHGRQGQLETASREFQDVLRRAPDFYKARANLGVVYYQLGRTQEAVDELQRVIKDHPEYAAAHYNLATLFHKENRSAEAVAEYREALRVWPVYAEARTNLALLYQQTGRAPDAVAELRTAVRLTPTYAPAHYTLANLLMEQGAVDEAIGEFRAAVRLDPGSADGHNNLGIAYARRRMTDEAIQAFQEAIRIMPTHADAHYNLGLVYQGKGEIDPARRQYEQALALRPGWEQVERQLGTIRRQETPAGAGRS